MMLEPTVLDSTVLDGTVHDSDAAALLDHEIDDLLLQVRGIALVRDVLADRGATPAEITAHSRALERARTRLAELIRGVPAYDSPRGSLLGEAA